MINGFVYKELKQNWGMFLSAVILGMYPLLNLWIGGNTLRDVESLNDWRMIEPLYVLICCSMYPVSLLKQDDRKIWCCFVSSTSSGYKGYILIKYVLLLIMSGISFTCTLIFDEVFRSVAASKGVMGLAVMTNTFIFYLSIQLIFLSVNMPLNFRLGPVKGNTIMVILWLFIPVLLIILAIVASFEFSVFDLIMKLRNAVESPVFLVVSVLTALLLYCISYFISCKAYLKRMNR